MSYVVRVSGNSAVVSSYDAAVKTAKQMLADTAANIRANARLFRSPKVRSTVAARMLRAAFPKKAGPVAMKVAGVVPVTIAKM